MSVCTISMNTYYQRKLVLTNGKFKASWVGCTSSPDGYIAMRQNDGSLGVMW